MTTTQLRKQLCDSPLLYSCQNPDTAREILASESAYGDADCIYIFSRMYGQNICIHFHFFNINKNQDEIRFYYFKANETRQLIHLHLQDTHYTPYFEITEFRQEAQNSSEIPEIAEFQQNYQLCDNHEMEIEMEIENEGSIEQSMEIDYDVNIPSYTDYRKHTKNHLDFHNNFTSNTFGHSCAVCDRLWWKRDLKNSSTKHENVLKIILNVISFPIFT